MYFWRTFDVFAILLGNSCILAFPLIHNPKPMNIRDHTVPANPKIRIINKSTIPPMRFRKPYIMNAAPIVLPIFLFHLLVTNTTLTMKKP